MSTKQRERRPFPSVTAAEVSEDMAKTARVNIRLTKREKDAMEKAATALGMTVTEYLVRSHAVVARHLS